MPREASATKTTSSGTLPTHAVLGLALGVVIGVAGTVYVRPSFEEGRDAAYAEIRSRLAERGIYDAETAGETMFLSGTLVSRSGSVLTVTTAEIPRDPLAPDTPSERRVTATSETKVFLQRPKADDVLEAERAEYLEAQRRLSAEVGPESDASASDIDAIEEPSPSVFQEISLDDIAPGVSLEIHADHDILFDSEFVATEIYVTERVAIPSDAPEAPRPGGADLPLPPDDAVVPPSENTGAAEDAPLNPDAESPTQ